MISPTGPGAAVTGWTIRAPQALAAPPADPQGRASDEKLQEARSALATLRQVRAGMGRSGKDAAIQKLAELKARLKSLMLLGGDPKTRAREAAAIAREIAAAARDYAAGGASPSAVAAAPAAEGDVVQGQAPPDARTDESPASDAPADATGVGQDASTSSAGQAPTEAARAQAGAPNDADTQFIQEARRLAQQAKAIIDAAAHSGTRARAHAAISREDAGAGERALQAIDSASRALGLDGGSPTAFQAVGSVVGTTISIKA